MYIKRISISKPQNQDLNNVPVGLRTKVLLSAVSGVGNLGGGGTVCLMCILNPWIFDNGS